ncbi:hypothetical protein RFI_27678 [Reticulomyxa filosa]|uniref:Uncharacterized protein n=1 Tax=Reticulomyxa filosa TaxID=46433 RepID=X6M6Z0_RETFI|nr:hypothetical protein RFI_27678 [Reticulomyxa filosa]|eukprot:ETO09694.1 hypothetical protein RFI_27678 [Reticulomyxa filosa]
MKRELESKENDIVGMHDQLEDEEENNEDKEDGDNDDNGNGNNNSNDNGNNNSNDNGNNNGNDNDNKNEWDWCGDYDGENDDENEEEEDESGCPRSFFYAIEEYKHYLEMSKHKIIDLWRFDRNDRDLLTTGISKHCASRTRFQMYLISQFYFAGDESMDISVTQSSLDARHANACKNVWKTILHTWVAAVIQSFVRFEFCLTYYVCIILGVLSVRFTL